MSVPPPPDLGAVTAALLGGGARFVIIGGFAVIANRYVRATEDVDLLVPDDPDNDRAIVAALAPLAAHRASDERPLDEAILTGAPHLRLTTSAGLIDLLREGPAPLDFATVTSHALTADLGAGPFPVAGLRSLVAFKRLADRPQDRNDLLALEAEHGALPIDPVPGLDLPGA